MSNGIPDTPEGVALALLMLIVGEKIPAREDVFLLYRACLRAVAAPALPMGRQKPLITDTIH